MRISDIVRLKYQDIYSDGKVKEIFNIYEGKTRQKRKIKPNSVLSERLLWYLERYQFVQDDYLFFSFRNSSRPIDRIQAWRIFHECAVECEIKNIGTQTMRQTYGWRILQKTKDIRIVQRELGNKKVKDTLKYLGIKSSGLDNVVF